MPDSEEVIFCMARLRWLVSKEDTCWANPLLSTSCLLTVSCLVSQDTQRAANTRNAPQANWPTMSLCFSSSIASSIGFSSSIASVSTSSLLHNLSSNLTRPLYTMQASSSLKISHVYNVLGNANIPHEHYTYPHSFIHKNIHTVKHTCCMVLLR